MCALQHRHPPRRPAPSSRGPDGRTGTRAATGAGYSSIRARETDANNPPKQLPRHRRRRPLPRRLLAKCPLPSGRAWPHPRAPPRRPAPLRPSGAARRRGERRMNRRDNCLRVRHRRPADGSWLLLVQRVQGCRVGQVKPRSTRRARCCSDLPRIDTCHAPRTERWCPRWLRLRRHCQAPEPDTEGKCPVE
jgi:hypothetical protein